MLLLESPLLLQECPFVAAGVPLVQPLQLVPSVNPG